MTRVFKEGTRVRVVKNRVPSDPIIGKTGTVVRSTGTVHPLWVVRLDGETYSQDDTGTLLNPSEIEAID